MGIGRRLRSWRSWLAAGLLFAAGCGSILGIEELVPQDACATAAECDDASVCTIDTCGADGVCQHEAEPDGPAATQTAGDCQRTECAAGAAQTVPDDADVPDDGNACTADLCTDGIPSNALVPAGTPCDDGNGHQGVCSDFGQCQVSCTAENAAEICDDANGCTTDSCDLVQSLCVHEALSGVPAPDAQQVAGDCALLVCFDGEEQPTIDNGDVPDDDNECTTDLCSSGVPSNGPVELGTTCSENGGQYCNGDPDSPACVECLAASDCTELPPDDECQARACTDGACELSFTLVNTPVVAQTAGDCHAVVCDGAGGTTTIVDDDDLPDDGNDCTYDVCTGGTPSHSNHSANDACGPGGALYCNASGVCVGCTSPAQCGTSTFCLTRTCTGGNCGVSYTTNGTALPSGDQVTGDCQQLQCNGTGGTKSVAYNSDVPPDEPNDCTTESCSTGTPVHPPKTINTACSSLGGAYCDGSGTCVDCNTAAQCPDPNPTNFCVIAACSSHNCGSANELSGTPLPTGQQVEGDCKLLVCDSSGGTTTQDQDSDVPVDGLQCTNDKCEDGAPSNPPLDPFSSCTQGGDSCDGAGNCVEGCSLEPTPPGGSCPSTCTGGCAGGTCTITCDVMHECETDMLVCPPGWECLVNCTDDYACRHATVVCPPYYRCEVHCVGGYACEDATIQCSPTGSCYLTGRSMPYDMRSLDMFCGENVCNADCDAPGVTPELHCSPSCSCQNLC